MAARRDPGADKACGRDRLPSTVASTEAYFCAASAILAMRASSTEVDISAALLKRHYGVTGSLATLSSEIERTVATDLSDGRCLILKTSTRREAVSSFRLQSEAIAGLRGATGFVAPDVLRTNTGALMFEDEEGPDGPIWQHPTLLKHIRRKYEVPEEPSGGKKLLRIAA